MFAGFGDRLLAEVCFAEYKFLVHQCFILENKFFFLNIIYLMDI